METLKPEIVFILMKEGKLQKGCAALIREIPMVQVYVFEEWFQVEMEFSHIKPKLMIIEAAIFNHLENVDIIHLIPEGVQTMILEENPLLIDKWKTAGVNQVILVGEPAPVLYSNIVQLLSQDFGNTKNIQ